MRSLASCIAKNSERPDRRSGRNRTKYSVPVPVPVPVSVPVVWPDFFKKISGCELFLRIFQIKFKDHFKCFTLNSDKYF